MIIEIAIGYILGRMFYNLLDHLIFNRREKNV